LDERDRQDSAAATPAKADRVDSPAASLYVVATPIGHLRDITLRALDVLAAVPAIYAEDTRVSSALLAHHGIATRPRSLNAHNEAARAAEVIGALSRGEAVAIVSDAGTPAISDPGARVVRAVRNAGYRVVPVPGPSAMAAALSAGGLVASQFHFAGFLPAKAGERDARLAALAGIDAAIVIYEAPHRIADSIAAIAAAFDPARTLVVARELTKAFETIASMPLADAPAWLAADADRRRGEFVLIVDAPLRGAAPDAALAEALRWIDALAPEMAPARAAHVVARMTGAPRDALYAHALARKRPPVA
jgi:16S rRNA (cytidine1402-2'-O)-methyltransferase